MTSALFNKSLILSLLNMQSLSICHVSHCQCLKLILAKCDVVVGRDLIALLSLTLTLFLRGILTVTQTDNIICKCCCHVFEWKGKHSSELEERILYKRNSYRRQSYKCLTDRNLILPQVKQRFVE